MIFTKQQGELQQSINSMALPVFVIDEYEGGEFRLVALNASHTKETGLTLEQNVDKTPQMILPKKADAEFLTSRYRTCITERKPIMYSRRLTYRDEIKEIRTTLHPVSLDGHAPTRLVGQVTVATTSIQSSAEAAIGGGILAKADIQAIEAILDNIRRMQTICSNDLMMLGTLMNNRRLSLSEVARMVETYDRAKKAQQAAKANDQPVSSPFNDLSDEVNQILG